jgi:hypothetical protein
LNTLLLPVEALVLGRLTLVAVALEDTGVVCLVKALAAVQALRHLKD